MFNGFIRWFENGCSLAVFINNIFCKLILLKPSFFRLFESDVCVAQKIRTVDISK